MRRFALSACLAFAAQASVAQLITVNVEAEYHHLGDNTVANFMFPNPEGLSLDRTLNLTSLLNSARSAYIEFKARNIDFSDLVINERVIAIPTTNLPGEADLVNPYRTQLIVVPAKFFIVGTNTLGFRVLRLNSGNYDDIEIGEIKVHFQ